MLVLATSVSMIYNSGKAIILKKIPCIYYLVCFQKDQKQARALLDSGKKVNIINPAYVKKLG